MTRNNAKRWLAALALNSITIAAQAFDAEGVQVKQTEPQHFSIDWKQSGPVDVFVAASPKASVAQMKPVTEDDSDGHFDATVSNIARPYFLLRAGDGSTYRTAERLLPLAGGSNFRDLGGYPAADGQHVRWGQLYRSGAMSKLTAADFDYLSTLDIKVLCDFRSVGERELSPTAWKAKPAARYTSVDYPSETLFKQVNLDPKKKDGPSTKLYDKMPDMLRDQYKAMFDELLAGRTPLAFNCSAGQDRTGIAAGLILTALGTPREVIYRDYLLSTALRTPKNEIADVDLEEAAKTNAAARFFVDYRKAQAAKPQTNGPQRDPLLDDQDRPLLQSAFESMEAEYGSVLGYMDKALGVDAKDVASLRRLYLE